MRQSLEEVLSIGQLIGSVKIAKVLAGMLDKAEPNSEFKMIENEQFFHENLLKDSDFVNSFKNACERGVKTTILLSPEARYKPHQTNPELTYSKEEIEDKERQLLYNRLCGAYAYGGIKNLTKYFMLSTQEDNRQITKDKAYNMAISFEKEVLGSKKYSLRISGFLNKIIGKYKKVHVIKN